MRAIMRATVSVLFVILVGCKSGDSGAEPPEDLVVGTITARIDDFAWRTTAAIGVYSGTRLAVAGSADNLTVGFGISTLSPGTYAVGGNFAPSGSMAQGVTVWEANTAGGSGTLTITSSEGREVAGTFSFTMVRTSGTGTPVQRVLTQGAFNIRY
jgi:hypothetical protein